MLLISEELIESVGIDANIQRKLFILKLLCGAFVQLWNFLIM